MFKPPQAGVELQVLCRLSQSFKQSVS